jgi:hypothetical protein
MDSLQQYQAYNSQFPAGKEVIDASLWDTLPYATGVTVALQFFTALRATIDLSNMRAAGQLPAPESFLIRAIRVYFKNQPESTATAAAGAVQPDSLMDIWLLITTGTLVLNIRNRFVLAKPILIKSQINFNVAVTWPAFVAPIRTFNMCVALDGDLIRAIQ